MTTLVSFLGRAVAVDGRVGYRRARYRFPDGRDIETPFFGLALREHLGADAMVLLGTAGSMWDVLIEHLARAQPDRYEAQRLELHEAAERSAVDDAVLEGLRPLVEETLGVRARLVLIPYGRTLDEQEQLLDDLAEVVREERSIHFDVTHGLRHLSMLALVASHLLEALWRNLAVEQIWYGAFELRDADGVVPVIGLDGLMRLQAWTEAWRRFEDDGDYGVFADLLEQEGLQSTAVEELRRAAFFESVLNLAAARKHLANFLPVLEAPLPGAARLFGGRLRERLRWVERADLYEHQRRLAQLHLAKHDYLRAAILANEAVLTRWMAATGTGDVHRQADRERARKEMLAEMREARRDADAEDFRALEAIRNALAHGSVPQWRRTRELLASPGRLHRELERIMSRLLT